MESEKETVEINEDVKQESVKQESAKTAMPEKEFIPRIERASVSKEEFTSVRRELSSLRTKKEVLFEIRSVISKEIKELFSQLKTLKEGRDELTQKVQLLKKQRDVINSEIKTEIDKVKLMRDATGGNATAVAAKPAGERINIPYVKDAIEKLQHYLETNALSPDEEKKVMKTIKEKERLIAKAKEQTESKGHLIETSKKIDDLKDNSNTVHAEVEVLAKNSQDKHEKLISISKDIKYLKTQEKEVHTLFITAKDAYRVKRITFVQNKPFFDQKKPRRDFRENKEEQILRKIEKTVEEKIRSGQKITTEDLLSFRP